MADYGGGAALEGRRNRVGSRGRAERRHGVRETVAVTLVYGVVQAQSREGIIKSWVRLRRVESEAQLDAGFELIDVVVGHALAPPHLALGFPPKPRFLTVGVRRPRQLLVERERPRRRRRGLFGGFRHIWGKEIGAPPLVRGSGDLAGESNWIGYVNVNGEFLMGVDQGNIGSVGLRF